MKKQFLTNAISSSPTIGVEAGANMDDVGGKAVKFDSDGCICLCDTEGEAAIGIVTIDNDVEVTKGDTVSVQIKDNGVVRLGADVIKGAELMTDGNGLFIPATTNKYVRAIALASGKNGSICTAMMCNYIKLVETSDKSDNTDNTDNTTKEETNNG